MVRVFGVPRAAAPLLFALFGSVAIPCPEVRAAEAGADDGTSESEVERLREQVERMRDRMNRLEARLDARQAAEAAETGTPAAPPEAGGSGPAGADASAAPGEEARRSEPDVAEAAPEPSIDITGALRFNAFWESDDASSDATRGDSALDLFRIGAEGDYGDLSLSTEYRFYPFMETIHHGWIGYQWSERDEVRAGISKVPFGILPYASHNYWFGAPYYLGLADDYDIGLKYRRRDGPLELDLAFFKNGELGDATNLDRYSFDVVRTTDPRHQNEETNQVNARLAYTFGEGGNFTNEVGVSGQWGQLHNETTGDNGDAWAAAVHWDSRYKRWNFQLQLARYGYDPENPAGVSDDTVRLGAFATSYDVASEATVGVANLAYSFPPPFEFVDSLTVYNDFSAVFKDDADFRDSYLNTTGFALGSGPLFIYLDFIQARNMVFFSDGSLAGGGNDDWDLRTNLNVGYYW